MVNDCQTFSVSGHDWTFFRLAFFTSTVYWRIYSKFPFFQDEKGQRKKKKNLCQYVEEIWYMPWPCLQRTDYC